MSDIKLGTIGAGAMAEAILNGVIKANIYEGKEIIASDVNNLRLKELEEKLQIRTTLDNKDVFKDANVIILAVKPQYLEAALKDISLDTKEKLIISIAAGIPISKIEDLIGKAPIIRVMPNTPALIGEGMAALCQNEFVTDEQIEIAENIFSAIGKTIRIDENLINAVTGLSGSGPAYVYQFIEALADGGVLVGLPRDTAYMLAAQTVLGASKMVLETGMHPGELKDKVTSPKGTTIEGVRVLEKNAFRASVMEAVEAGFIRAQNLGS